MKRKKPPQIIAYFESLRDLQAVRAAATRSRLSMSAFVARAALDSANSDSVTARLLDAPAFRGAIADVMCRPAVVAELAERLKLSSPAQLELFRRDMAKGLGVVGRGRG